ncbi:MAG: hypothetical protein JWN48_2713 [Myxococcaceae bacterium]|nr:hypothetical protein [Myxococcaceae bacterium]
MDRTAVFVDAGYLFAAGSTLIAGERLRRSELVLDPEALLELLRDLNSAITGLPLLRVYWYDGSANGPTGQQLSLAYRPGVKLRLGSVNQQHQQKGVDSLFVSDLLNLARNRAMADAILLTGDEDIRIGVLQAQEFGVRVHLIGIEAPSGQHNLSGSLVQEADSLRALRADEVRTFMRRIPSASYAPYLAAEDVEPALTAELVLLDEATRHFVQQLGPEEIDSLLQYAGSGTAVPPHIDKRLLVAGTQAIDEQLSHEQKRRMREVLLEHSRKLDRR